MLKRLRIPTVLFISLLLAASALAILPEDPMPEMKLVDLEGQPVALSDLKGKPVVVNFWASWCPPCKAEMPELNTIYADYKAKGVEVVGINLDEGIAVAKGYLAGNPVAYPVWADAPLINGQPQANFDRTRNLFHELNPSGAIPFTIFVRRDGTVEDTLTGFDPEVGRGKIERRIKLILAGQ